MLPFLWFINRPLSENSSRKTYLIKEKGKAGNEIIVKKCEAPNKNRKLAAAKISNNRNKLRDHATHDKGTLLYFRELLVNQVEDDATL